MKTNEAKPALGLDAVLDEAWRCLQCEDPPCEPGCAAAVPVRRFIRKIRNLDFHGAARVIRAANVLGGSCARVCATDRQCQRGCTRSQMDRPVDIGALQRFATDWEMAAGRLPAPSLPNASLPVAVVGAGPAGLAAAAELARLGYQVTVFEREQKPGGLLRYAIPSWRLPLNVVDFEISALSSMGVEFRCGQDVQDYTALRSRYRALVVAVGLSKPVRLALGGEDLPGVYRALDVLRAKVDSTAYQPGKKVVVIGGGNTAMDVAAFAAAAGAEEVTVLYRRSEQQMPAWPEEVRRAREQGVFVRTFAQPTALLEAEGKVSGLRCLVTRLGDQDESGRRRPQPIPGSVFEVPADEVIVAIGEVFEEGAFEADMAAQAGVFVAGDMTQSPRTVVDAVASGKSAAQAAHAFLGTATEPALAEPISPIDLSVDFCGVRLNNPFLLAAAPPTDDLDMLRAGFRAGWAGAVLKTTAVEDEPVELKYPMMAGYSVYGRRVVGLGNIDLISEHHIDVVEKRIRCLKEEFPDRVLIGSIMGSDRSHWDQLVQRLEAAGADIIECSFSCPQGTLGGEGSFSGQMLGQNPELVREVTSWIKSAAQRAPVVIKITPQVANIAEVAQAVREGGADAICASNTVPSLMGIDLQNFAPWPDVNGCSSFAGLSGPAIFPITLRNIALAARAGGLPVTGTGGPINWKDAVQMMAVGAVSIQFCTAVMTFGFDLVEDLVSGLGEYLQEQGLSSPADLVGRSLDRIVSHDQLRPFDKVRSRVDPELCIGCGRCVIACRDGGHQAIDFAADRRPVIRDDRCVGCGMCAAVCPISDCLGMVGVSGS